MRIMPGTGITACCRGTCRKRLMPSGSQAPCTYSSARTSSITWRWWTSSAARRWRGRHRLLYQAGCQRDM